MLISIMPKVVPSVMPKPVPTYFYTRSAQSIVHTQTTLWSTGTPTFFAQECETSKNFLKNIRIIAATFLEL